MANGDKTQDTLPLLILEHYGLPAQMREHLVAFFDHPDVAPAKELAAAMSTQLHQEAASSLAQKAATLHAEHVESPHYCHALGWLALERDAHALQALFVAIPPEHEFYVHAEWVVPFPDHPRCERSFGCQYFLAHYNELYVYPQGNPPGLLTATGLCAQVLALMCHNNWETILPVTNQMITDFNKLLWFGRDFKFLGKMAGEKPESFQKIYDEMRAAQEQLQKDVAQAEKDGKSSGVSKDAAKKSSEKKTSSSKSTGGKK